MTKLSELAEIVSGKSVLVKDYTTKGTRVLRAGDITTDNKIVFKDKKFITDATDSKILKPNDIVMVVVGSTIGNCAPYTLKEKIVPNQNVVIIKPKIKALDLLKKLNEAKPRIKKMAKGAAYPNISTADLMNLNI